MDEKQFALIPLEVVTAVSSYLESKPLPYTETAPLIMAMRAARLVKPAPAEGDAPKAAAGETSD